MDLLKDNPSEVKNSACEILVKLLSNVVSDPNNPKYRQIKLANKTIEEKLLPASGAFEILFSVGFEEADDKLILPLDANIKTIEKFRDAIRDIDKDPKAVTKPAETASANPTPATLPTTAATPSSAMFQPGLQTSEREFYSKLINCLNHMTSYEDKTAQVK